jgi:hypothetical protein
VTSYPHQVYGLHSSHEWKRDSNNLHAVEAEPFLSSQPLAPVEDATYHFQPYTVSSQERDMVPPQDLDALLQHHVAGLEDLMTEKRGRSSLGNNSAAWGPASKSQNVSKVAKGPALSSLKGSSSADMKR